MPPSTRSPLDALITGLDQALRTLAGGPDQRPMRPYPAEDCNPVALSLSERAASAAMMRVNHTGEVCAQALYLGQALAVKDRARERALEAAAQEEEDHLLWCARRLQELESRPSRLNVLWFVGAFALGAVAGLAGDRASMGFLEETEAQVGEHLAGHLARLSPKDEASRRVVKQMRQDEARHAATARRLGASELPLPVRWAMRLQAKVMTTVAAKI